MPHTSSEHPDEGTLRAYIDGELPPAATLQCAIHVRRCPTCRLTLRGVRERGHQVADLLTWVRAPRRGDSRIGFYSSAIGVAAALVLGTLLSVSLRQQPATHSRTAGGTHVQDVCCFNLDGGGRRDDGMLTVSRADQVVDCVVLYEDRAGKRAFSPHDPLRFISQPEGCTTDVVAAAIADPLDRPGL
jgi:putative zinc finger protein